MTLAGLEPPLRVERQADVRAALAGVRELEFRPELWAETAAMIRQFGREPTPNNRLQALIPAGSRPIRNPVGTAPGFWLRIGRCLVLALPGVPHEMRRMLEQAVVPLVVTLLGMSGATVVRVLHTAGLAESEVDERIADLERRKGALREVLATQVGLTGGEPVARPLATVKFAAVSERVTYDRRALDALSASDPTLAGILSPHRKVTVVPPSLRVEWRREVRS